MYRTDFELPAKYQNLEGKDDLEKIISMYQVIDSLDDVAVGVYKVFVDENENVQDVVYVYTNPKLGQLTHNDHLWMRGRSYLDTVPGASSKWFDISYAAAYRNKIIKDKIYAPGPQQVFHFTAKQAFAPGFAIFTYTAVHDVSLSDAAMRQAYKTNDLVITISKLLRTPGSIEKVMARTMEEVGRMMVLDQLYIIETIAGQLKCEYEWHKSDRPSVKRRLNEISEADLLYGFEAYEANTSCVDITSDELHKYKQENPAFAEFFLSGQVSEVIAAPFYYRGKLQGYLIGENPKKEDLLKKELLETASFFFGSELRAGRLVRELEYRDNHDLLTDIQSRNAMEKDIERLQKLGISLAVVYVDLNNLKQINDEIGHAAGDKKLRETAYLMAEIFNRQSVYRAGGDEFVVLREQLSENEMFQKIAELRTLAVQRGLSLAVGGCYVADSSNLRQAMTDADAVMYEDKNRYYKTHARYDRGKGQYPVSS